MAKTQNPKLDGKKTNPKTRTRSGSPSRSRPSLTQEAQSAYAANKINRPLQLLGVSGVGSAAQFSDADFIDLIRKGFPKKSLDTLMHQVALTLEEITRIFHISARTLRRYEAKTTLSQEQSERLLELARLYSRGEEVFGSLDHFTTWCNSTIKALGDRSPKSFMDTSLGIDVLMDELGRIEYGTFS